MIYVWENGKLVTKGENIAFAYLNDENEVIAKSPDQKVVPGASKIIEQIKDETFNCLIPKCKSPQVTYYHKLKSGAEGKDFSDYEVVWDLDACKAIRIAEVDLKTEELVDQGYEFDEALFSSTLEDQKNWIALTMSKDSLPYPFPVTTKDDQTFYFQNPDHLTQFFGYGMNVINTIYAGGREIKQLVLAASTKAALDQIVDPR